MMEEIEEIFKSETRKFGMNIRENDREIIAVSKRGYFTGGGVKLVYDKKGNYIRIHTQTFNCLIHLPTIKGSWFIIPSYSTSIAGVITSYQIVKRIRITLIDRIMKKRHPI